MTRSRVNPRLGQLIVVASFVGAVGVSPASAKCPDPIEHMTSEEVQNLFDYILGSDPTGGYYMAERSAALVVTPSLRVILRSILPNANPAQIESIAKGVAGAYTSCQTKDPSLANDIDNFARGITNEDFHRTYRSQLSKLDQDGPGVALSNDDGRKPAYRPPLKNLGLPALRNPSEKLSLPGSSWLDH